MSLCYTDVTDNSSEVECDTLRANVTSERQDVTAAESTRDVSEVDDVTERANHLCSPTIDTFTRSPEPTVQTVAAPSSGRPSRLTKFIDRRTETLISACTTVSTSTLDDVDVTRDTNDVIDTRQSSKQMTSPVLRLTKYRDRKFDVSSSRDYRQLGVTNDVTVHRSMLPSVPATTSVNVVRAPASLICLLYTSPSPRDS